MLIAKPVPHQMVRDSVEIRGSVLDNDLLALKVGYRSADSDDLQLIASGINLRPPPFWPIGKPKLYPMVSISFG